MQRDSIPAQSFVMQYREACRQTDELFSLIRSECLTVRPVRERHRLLFYIGHLEAFDWNLLSARLFELPAFNASFDTLFAFGIDPVGGGLPTDEPKDWPALSEIYAYRDAVRERIESAIPDVDFSRSRHSAGDADAATLLQVVIEHRQMHAETLAYLVHQMPLAQKIVPDKAALPARAMRLVAASPANAADAAFTVSGRSPSNGSPTLPGMACVAAGDVQIGLPIEAGVDESTSSQPMQQGARAFGWDNEFVDAGKQRVAVAEFLIDRHMVSNRDFLVFVNAGGYSRPEYWRPDDWAWRCAADVTHPAFWEPQGEGWALRTMFTLRSLPLDWPVYVSHAEAEAYAYFVGKRLPSESEWMRAAIGASDIDRPPVEGNFDFRHWDPVPVDAYPQNRSAFDVHGQFGNGWEWTADFFTPFSGFQPFSFYPGYSADFFDNRHFVMKGGSPRTAARMLRPTFRNWFQPHYPYVYAGFRCAADLPK